LLPELAGYLRGESLEVRRINLIGHSLGARILVKSLLASPETARELPLDNLLLMGGAICTSSPWDEVSAPLKGRVINCHSSKDWALALKPDTERCIGRYAILTPALKAKVSNVHLATRSRRLLAAVADGGAVHRPVARAARHDPRRPAQQRGALCRSDADLFPALVQARPEELKFLPN
jgi:pimeloyl-ACP methyl ester carboxylesterase